MPKRGSADSNLHEKPIKHNQQIASLLDSLAIKLLLPVACRLCVRDSIVPSALGLATLMRGSSRQLTSRNYCHTTSRPQNHSSTAITLLYEHAVRVLSVYS